MVVVDAVRACPTIPAYKRDTASIVPELTRTAGSSLAVGTGYAVKRAFNVYEDSLYVGGALGEEAVCGDLTAASNERGGGRVVRHNTSLASRKVGKYSSLTALRTVYQHKKKQGKGVRIHTVKAKAWERVEATSTSKIKISSYAVGSG